MITGRFAFSYSCTKSCAHEGMAVSCHTLAVSCHTLAHVTTWAHACLCLTSQPHVCLTSQPHVTTLPHSAACQAQRSQRTPTLTLSSLVQPRSTMDGGFGVTASLWSHSKMESQEDESLSRDSKTTHPYLYIPLLLASTRAAPGPGRSMLCGAMWQGRGIVPAPTNCCGGQCCNVGATRGRLPASHTATAGKGGPNRLPRTAPQAHEQHTATHIVIANCRPWYGKRCID